VTSRIASASSESIHRSSSPRSFAGRYPVLFASAVGVVAIASALPSAGEKPSMFA